MSINLVTQLPKQKRKAELFLKKVDKYVIIMRDFNVIVSVIEHLSRF